MQYDPRKTLHHEGLNLLHLYLPCNFRTAVALGKGQFGDVEIGTWTNYGRMKEVAVKTLNSSSAKPEDKIKFLQEAAIMAQFKHPNVIQLYGIVTDGEPVSMQCGIRCRKEGEVGKLNHMHRILFIANSKM